MDDVQTNDVQTSNATGASASVRANVLWLALAVALLLVVGSGLVALTQDTGAFSGNQVDSNEFVGAHDVQVDSVFGTTCDDAVYEESGGNVFFLRGEFDVNTQDANGSQVASDTLCVVNNGIGTGELLLSADNVVSTDLGCGPGEAAVDELGCNPDDLSDIQNRILVDLEAFGTGLTNQGDSCTSGSNWISLIDLSVGLTLVADPSMGPSDVCQYRVRLRYPSGMDESFLARDQTDRLFLDLVFTLQDVPAS